MVWVRASILALAAIHPSLQHAAETPELDVSLTGVELVAADFESLQVEIFVEADSKRATSVRSFSFHRLTCNGMPAYIAPVLGPLEIPAGGRVRLGPFPATFFFRDLNTLEPVRTLVRDARIRIEGVARVEIELDWIERLALWSRRAVVWRPFDESMDVRIPGGVIRQVSAQAFFALAEPLVQAGLDLRRARDRWLDRAWDESMGRIAAVRSSYVYQRPGEEPVRVETLATGVLVPAERVLVPIEVIEPWRFDPAIAYAMQRGELELAPGGDVEILLPAHGGHPREEFRVSRAEIRVDRGKCETERVLFVDGNGRTRKAKVCQSSGARNLAALELLQPSKRPFQPWPLAFARADGPVDLAAMRLIRAPETGGRWWEMVQLRGEIQAGQIALAEPIDRSALGSLILVGGQPAGILQHERGGVLLPVESARR